MKMRVLLVAFLVVLVASTSGFAAGFALIEQSVKGLGNSFAGGAAVAEDASTVYFNPAGMTRLEGIQTTAAMHLIIPSAEFNKTSATNAFGAPISGGDGGDGGQVKLAPNAYVVKNMGDVAFGLGINAPFGMATDYGKTWVGRYHAVESDVLTVNINPSMAYKINDNFSVGGGVNVQYIEATLSAMVDFGTMTIGQLFQGAAAAAAGGDAVTAATLNGQATALLGAGVASNADADIFSEMVADDWGYGYNLGALYTRNATRIGLAYRSEIEYELSGDAIFEIQNPAYLAGLGLLTAAQGTFVNQGVSGKITLPASAELSVYQQFNDQWSVMANVMWTQWSCFDQLKMEFDGTLATRPSVTEEDWEDNWRYAIGTVFTPNDSWAFRAGLAYDETPIPDNRRTPRIPGSNRTWISFGSGYKTGNWSFDAAYAHLFVDDAPIELVDGGTGRGNLNGDFDNVVDIISIEASLKF